MPVLSLARPLGGCPRRFRLAADRMISAPHLKARLRNPPRTLCMNDPQAPLHVNPIGGNWEVESEAGTLGQAETKAKAEEMATGLARELGAVTVSVHTSDGFVEKDIAVSLEESLRTEE